MVKEITSVEEFEELISPLSEWSYRGDDKTIIDFYSPTCMPCKQMFPIFDELEEVTTYKIDCTKLPEIASTFGVQSVPHLILIPSKTEDPQMHVGVLPKDKILEIMG